MNKKEAYKLYIDGACWGNPGISSGGMQIVDHNDKEIFKGSVFFGKGTNNTAEYKAIIEGLKAALRIGVNKLRVFSDSELAIKQLNGQYRVRAANLAELNKEVCVLKNRFNSISFHHLGREHTTAAHNLAEGVLKSL
ncbi:MAG: ribonuclease HI family protein [Elusimicrobiota bacterium]